MTADMGALLRAVAAFGLAGSRCALPDEPLPDAVWDAFMGGVTAEKLQGFLAFAVLEGALPVTPAQYEAVGQEHRLLMAHVLRLERLVLQCTEVLENRAIDFRLLKGSALACLDYPDPAYRAFVDVDLLLPPDAMTAAVAALSSLGARRHVPEVGPGFDQHFAKSVTLLAPGGYEIDLHRTFAMDTFGFGINLVQLFQRPDVIHLGGRRVLALPAEARFLHACYHAILGDAPPRLLPLRDVAQLLVANRLNEERVIQQAEEWHGGVVVARAVQAALQTFQLPATTSLATWASARPSTRREQRALSGYTDARRSQAKRALTAVAALPTWNARRQYLRALLLPSPDFVATRGGRLRWIRRGIKRFVALPQRRRR